MVKFVVGNRLSNLISLESYISFEQYLNELNQQHPEENKVLYIPAQGLTDNERKVIYRDNKRNFPVVENYKFRQLQKKEAMHKSEQKNVLITELEEIKPGNYHSELILHNDNELILDHFSGNHIPGMVFLEAARQISIAAWAKYEQADPRQATMIINDIACEYKKFAFAFCIDIDISITPLGDSNYGMDINFIQNGGVIVRSYGSFQTTEKAKLTSLEYSMMKKMTRIRSNYFLNKVKEDAAT